MKTRWISVAVPTYVAVVFDAMVVVGQVDLTLLESAREVHAKIASRAVEMPGMRKSTESARVSHKER